MSPDTNNPDSARPRGLKCILDAIKYKYRPIGKVEKDGHLLKKYVKEHRFHSKHRRMFSHFLLTIIAASIGVFVIKHFMNACSPPSDEPTVIEEP